MCASRCSVDSFSTQASRQIVAICEMSFDDGKSAAQDPYSRLIVQCHATMSFRTLTHFNLARLIMKHENLEFNRAVSRLAAVAFSVATSQYLWQHRTRPKVIWGIRRMIESYA